jgi:hypothetical protein
MDWAGRQNGHSGGSTSNIGARSERFGLPVCSLVRQGKTLNNRMGWFENLRQACDRNAVDCQKCNHKYNSLAGGTVFVGAA